MGKARVWLRRNCKDWQSFGVLVPRPRRGAPGGAQRFLAVVVRSERGFVDRSVVTRAERLAPTDALKRGGLVLFVDTAYNRPGLGVVACTVALGLHRRFNHALLIVEVISPGWCSRKGPAHSGFPRLDMGTAERHLSTSAPAFLYRFNVRTGVELTTVNFLLKGSVQETFAIGILIGDSGVVFVN